MIHVQCVGEILKNIKYWKLKAWALFISTHLLVGTYKQYRGFWCSTTHTMLFGFMFFFFLRHMSMIFCNGKVSHKLDSCRRKPKNINCFFFFFLFSFRCYQTSSCKQEREEGRLWIRQRQLLHLVHRPRPAGGVDVCGRGLLRLGRLSGSPRWVWRTWTSTVSQIMFSFSCCFEILKNDGNSEQKTNFLNHFPFDQCMSFFTSQ